MRLCKIERVMKKDLRHFAALNLMQACTTDPALATLIVFNSWMSILAYL